MVGYTALMQEDEHRAKNLRDRHRTVLRDTIEEHGGEIVQFYGDGTLSVFPSAVQGVASAVRIQQAFSEDPQIPVRIGLHVGDIVHDEDGVHGDGVNVAARIQGMAIPGSVLVSDKIYDEVKNHRDYPTVALGSFELKNVQEPQALYALKAERLTVPAADELAGTGHLPKKSIAVLPFVSMSSDQEDEYFADGITEDLINALTRFEGLQVTARTSSFAFKNKNEDIRKIGEALNVGVVLEGSVRRAGNRIRIAAQLIDTRDGYHLFSNVYDRVLDDIFETQDELASTIAEELRVLLPTDPQETPATRAKKPTEDSEAYSAYLRGLFSWNKWTPDDTMDALRAFERSVQLDPNFALAHSGIARCYIHLGAVGRMSSEEALTRAETAAMRALELDPESAEAQMGLGLIHLFYHWDLPAAKSHLERALELNPGSAEGHCYLGFYLMAAGKLDQLVEVAEAAVALDPLSPVMLDALGRALVVAGRPERGSSYFDRALELAPGFRSAQEGKGLSYLIAGRPEEAIRELEAYRRMIPGGLGGYAPLVNAYAAAGRMTEAEDYLALIQERAPEDPSASADIELSAALAGLGRIEEALDHVQRAIERKDASVAFLRTGPMWLPLRDHPRFEEMLSAVGL
jgi:TolB-like protein/Tfp pilus assembly protein PilF